MAAVVTTSFSLNQLPMTSVRMIMITIMMSDSQMGSGLFTASSLKGASITYGEPVEKNGSEVWKGDAPAGLLELGTQSCPALPKQQKLLQLLFSEFLAAGRGIIIAKYKITRAAFFHGLKPFRGWVVFHYIVVVLFVFSHLRLRRLRALCGHAFTICVFIQFSRARY